MKFELTKENFINLIDSIEEFDRGANKLEELLGQCEYNGWFYAARDSLVDFLNSIFYTKEEFNSILFISDIDYYIFELDFGKKWSSGMITIDGKDFPLRNSEELWNLLMAKKISF